MNFVCLAAWVLSRLLTQTQTTPPPPPPSSSSLLGHHAKCLWLTIHSHSLSLSLSLSHTHTQTERVNGWLQNNMSGKFFFVETNRVYKQYIREFICCSTNKQTNKQTPQKGENVLRLTLGGASRFDMCRALCRTSSHSVVNQHTYKGTMRHCFASSGPEAKEKVKEEEEAHNNKK